LYFTRQNNVDKVLDKLKMTHTKHNTQNLTFVHIEQLALDSQNLRLPSIDVLERTQQAMLEYLARETSIEELMSAIAENDFFEGESLIVIPNDKQPDQYIVVEGNRRLIALRLLQEPDLFYIPSENVSRKLPKMPSTNRIKCQFLVILTEKRY
jgi:hypothetical protein